MSSEEKAKTKDEKVPEDAASNTKVNAISPAPEGQPQMMYVAAPMSDYGYGNGYGFQPPVHTPAKRGCFKQSGECCCGFSRACCYFTWIGVTLAILLGLLALCLAYLFLLRNSFGRGSKNDPEVTKACCRGKSSQEAQITVYAVIAKVLCNGGHKRADPNCTDGPTCKIETVWAGSQWTNYTAQNDCYDFPVVGGSKDREFENGTCQCTTSYCNCPPRLKGRSDSGSDSGSDSRKSGRRFGPKSLVNIPVVSDVLSFTFYSVFAP